MPTMYFVWWSEREQDNRYAWDFDGALEVVKDGRACFPGYDPIIVADMELV